MDKKNENESKIKSEKDEVKLPKNKVSEGMKLELRAKRLLFHMGYFPVQGIFIKTGFGEDSDVITDLDVYGLYLHKDFRRKTLWLDCKSGFSKPLERISWIKGIKQTLNIDDAIFINRKMRLDTKQYAIRSGIQIFDKNILEQIEKNYNISEDDWHGSWSMENINLFTSFSNLNIPDRQEFKKIAAFMSSEFWSRDAFTQLKKCITALRSLSIIPYEVMDDSENKAYRWGVYHLVELFTLSLLDICKDLYFLDYKDRTQILLEGILSSDMPLKRRNEIYQSAITLANELIKDKYPNAQIKTDKSINITPPYYFEAIDDLINRIINDPLTYYDILRSMDVLFMEYDLNRKALDNDFIMKYCPNYQVNERGIKTILHLVNQITNISKNHFQLIS